MVGYATWNRGRGYDGAAVLTVEDCLALTSEAAAALVGSLRGWEMVVPTLRWRPLPWTDAVALQLPLEKAREHGAEIWMHRPLDLVAAVTGRGWPAGAGGSVAFRVHDPVLDANTGAWRLTLDGGVPENLRGAIVALGNFDGFHLGHQAVVGRAVQRAFHERRPAIVATFDPHPVRFFKPDVPPFRLTSLDQREHLFARNRTGHAATARFAARSSVGVGREAA